MKLVDILARELKAWPEGAGHAHSSGHLARFSDSSGTIKGICLDIGQEPEDHMTASVTRAEWQAAVDALNAPKVAGWEQGDIPPIGEACEAYVLADTENQGRPMNRWISGKFIGKALSDNGGIILMVECEDGWAHAINAFSYVRPIRTAEQVAAEEREKGIQEICTTLCWRNIRSDGSAQEAAILYDAGYRKEPNPCGS